MKRKTKRTGVLLVALFMVAHCSTVAMASGSQDLSVETETLRQQTMAEYMQDEEFRRNLEEDPESAMQIIENAMSKASRQLLSPMAGDQAVAYCTVPDIWQKPNQCGATSAYQAIAGAGYAANIPGADVEAKIETIWQEVRTDTAGSSIVWKVTRSLNTYIPNGNYTYKEGRTIGQSAFELYTTQSLLADHPVILHALTKEISYYNKHDSHHYICVSVSNRNSGTMTVVDCNNNADYHGTHTITVQEAYSSISESGRYLIYG